MTTNVSVEYAIAQKKFDEAKTLEEKLAALQEMYSHAPSHKAAENLRKQLTKKLAKLREEIEKEKVKKSSAGGMGQSVAVKKEGDAQIVIVGAPNTGKSTLLKLLTHADVQIAPYAFTTTKPELGMLEYGNAKIQMVEVPALIEGASKGKAQGTQHLGIIRNADAMILILNSTEEFDLIKKECLNVNIKINETKPNIIVKNSDFPGVHITGNQYLTMPEEKLVEFLKGFGKQNSDVFLGEPVTLEKIAEVLNESIVYKKTIIICKDAETKKEVEKKCKGKILIVPDFNSIPKNDVENFKKGLFQFLGKIFVYTKKPGQEANMQDPLILDSGTTVEKVAGYLHKDLAKNLKYVKLWGSGKFEGQRVNKEYALKNGDIIEIVT